MNLRRIWEKENIETVGALREALADMPDDMPVCDGVGEPLLVSLFEDEETGDRSIEIG